MPFYRLRDDREADVIIKQHGDKSWEVRQEFRYVTPDGQTYIVPKRFCTDLASVPWFFWWLVASYGRHTRAALVHDTLIGPDAIVKVERKYADWILLTALDDTPEGERRGSWCRHQLMWVAVCLFGTMRQCSKALLGLFLLHVAVFWVSFASVLLGWSPFGWQAVPWVGVVAVGALGFAWTFNPQADRRLASRLWPVGAVGLPLVLPAVLLVGATAVVIWVLDVIPAIVQGRGVPPIGPTRFPA